MTKSERDGSMSALTAVIIIFLVLDHMYVFPSWLFWVGLSSFALWAFRVLLGKKADKEELTEHIGGG